MKTRFAITSGGALALLVVLAVPIGAQANPIVNYNDKVTAIFGTGNPAQGWTTATDNGLVLGLRAKNHTTGATPTNGAGVYTFLNGNVWNFEFSVQDPNLGLDGDQFILSGSTFAGFNALLIPDNAYGTAATLSGGGGPFVLGDTIAQNSEKISFAPFGGLSFNTPGVYTFDLQAVNADNVVLNNVGITVVDAGVQRNVAERASTIWLMGLGITIVGGLAMIERRRAPLAIPIQFQLV